MSLEEKWKKFTEGHVTAKEFIVGKGTVEKVIEELLNNLSGEKLNFKTNIQKSDSGSNPYYSIPTEYEGVIKVLCDASQVSEAMIENYRNVVRVIRNCENVRDITKLYHLKISSGNNALDEENLSELEKELKNTEDMFKSKVLKEVRDLAKDEFVRSLKEGKPFYLELERGNRMELLSITRQGEPGEYEVTIYYDNFSSLGEASWTKGKILHDLGGIAKILREESNKNNYTTKNT